MLPASAPVYKRSEFGRRVRDSKENYLCGNTGQRRGKLRATDLRSVAFEDCKMQLKERKSHVLLEVLRNKGVSKFVLRGTKSTKWDTKEGVVIACIFELVLEEGYQYWNISRSIVDNKSCLMVRTDF